MVDNALIININVDSNYALIDINVNKKTCCFFLDMLQCAVFLTRPVHDEMTSVKRRRSADEARAHILQVAASRLREHGVEGLNIKGVAEAAGISHATLIHHFGSSAGMREALAQSMTAELLQDLVVALESNVSPESLTKDVFVALAEGGHAMLLAWRAVEAPEKAELSEAVTDLFDQLLGSAQGALEIDSRADLQRVIMLVATSAIGYGIAGGVLAQVLGMDPDTVESFPAWMTERINHDRPDCE